MGFNLLKLELPKSPDPMEIEGCKPYLITRLVRRPMICHYDNKDQVFICSRALFEKGD